MASKWFRWIRSTREAAGFSRKATLDLFSTFQGEVPFTESNLEDVEHGRRKFSRSEFTHWLSIFNPTNAPTIPLCLGRELEVRVKMSKQMREKWATDREGMTQKITGSRRSVRTRMAVATLPSTKPVVIEVEVDSRAQDIQKTITLLQNPRLSNGEVHALCTSLRLEVGKLFGLE